MKNEIDEAHYCVGDKDECEYENGECESDDCPYRRRKWPTPEQYKAEYGRDWPDDAAVYYLTLGLIAVEHWAVVSKDYLKYRDSLGPTVCACTPFGTPPDDWRPE
jgi:hypothetical protein